MNPYELNRLAQVCYDTAKYNMNVPTVTDMRLCKVCNDMYMAFKYGAAAMLKYKGVEPNLYGTLSSLYNQLSTFGISIAPEVIENLDKWSNIETISVPSHGELLHTSMVCEALLHDLHDVINGIVKEV